MKVSHTAISVIAVVAQAQSIADLEAQTPSCAMTCLASAIVVAGCSMTDTACLCGSMRKVISASATPCVIAACSIQDALKFQQLGNQICRNATLTKSNSSLASSTTILGVTSTALFSLSPGSGGSSITSEVSSTTSGTLSRAVPISKATASSPSMASSAVAATGKTYRIGAICSVAMLAVLTL